MLSTAILTASMHRRASGSDFAVTTTTEPLRACTRGRGGAWSRPLKGDATRSRTVRGPREGVRGRGGAWSRPLKGDATRSRTVRGPREGVRGRGGAWSRPLNEDLDELAERSNAHHTGRRNPTVVP